MRTTRLVLGELDTNCWIVSDDSDGPAIIIDPADDAEAILDAVGERIVAMIALTHGHFDHIGAARALVERTGAPLAAHELDGASVTTAEGSGGARFGFTTTAPEPTVLLADGECFSAGKLGFTVLHTPGHTPGGICLLAEDGTGPAQLFSGDTLFAGSVGRTDFPGGDARALARSIAEKLATLPADTVVHPGHGADTTIERERRVNFFWPRG